MAFSVTVHDADGERTLHVDGELDIASAAELRSAGDSAFADPSVTAVRVDLRGVTFMDSTGLGVLIGLRNGAETAGKDLVLTDPSPTVSRLLELSGLLKVFRVEDAPTV
jgi:anti-anti-sigma factor